MVLTAEVVLEFELTDYHRHEKCATSITAKVPLEFKEHCIYCVYTVYNVSSVYNVNSIYNVIYNVYSVNTDMLVMEKKAEYT